MSDKTINPVGQIDPNTGVVEINFHGILTLERGDFLYSGRDIHELLDRLHLLPAKYFRLGADYGFNATGLNEGLTVTDEEIRQQLAKEEGKQE